MLSVQEEIDDLRQRLARAETDRDAWRAAGRGERYLESYFLVEALELQIHARLRGDISAAHADTLPGYLSR
jgi:hypothetical protein